MSEGQVFILRVKQTTAAYNRKDNIPVLLIFCHMTQLGIVGTIDRNEHHARSIQPR
jgi:hypothetical protein